MIRKLGCLMFVVALSLPALAAGKPGSISGYVRSSDGTPQMGAMVEVLGSAFQTIRAFSDENGFYTVPSLLAGTYNVRVSAPTFLTTLRERVGLRPGSKLTLNLTLTTLFEAIQLGPARGVEDEDDWKWVLRSAANRPILRLVDGKPVVVEGGTADDTNLRGSLSFVAGSASSGYGSASDVSTGFAVEKSIFSTGVVNVQGNLGGGPGSPAGVLRTSYSHRMPNGSEPQITFTMRRLAAPELGQHSSSLQALTVNASNNVTLGDVVELRFGSEMQTIQFMGRLTAFRPFGSVDLHLSPDAILEYRYASSQADPRAEKGFESAPADLSESGPHLSMTRFSPALERAHHHEVSLSKRAGKNKIQLAAFMDRIIDPALIGVGEFSAADGNALSDPYSGTFTYRGKDLETQGIRLVMERKVTSNMTATVDYGFGGVLDLVERDVELDDAQAAMRVKNRHSVAAKMSGTVPATKTRWIASYRWTDGQALTPVDMYNASPGQTDPFLSFFVRQPIPGTNFIPGVHMDALLDVRNLLAQGYVPVLGQDGRTLYLVQSARAVRGGVAFTF